MKNITNELNELVENKKELMNKNSKFKYSTRRLYALTGILQSYQSWMVGSEGCRGFIKKYELVDGEDYKAVKKLHGTTRVYTDYMVTLEVYCFLLLKLNKVNNADALDIIKSHLTAYQSDDNVSSIIVSTGRSDVEKVLNKLNLI